MVRMISLALTLAAASAVGAAAMEPERREMDLRSAAEQIRRRQAARMAATGETIGRLARRWPAEEELRLAPAMDKDVRALLRRSNRTALALVLGDRLGGPPPVPPGPERTVLLYLAGRCRRRELGRHLPALLRDAATATDRAEVLECMAALGDPDSVRALTDMLDDPPEWAAEDLRAIAVRGLGRTHDADCLAVINRARRRFVAGPALLAGAIAAYNCGEKAAFADVTGPLQGKTPGVAFDAPTARAAIEFLVHNFGDESFDALRAYALAAPTPELSARAIHGLITAGGYGLPDPDAAPKDVPPAAGEETTTTPPPDPTADMPQTIEEITKLTPRDRTVLVARLTTWWREQGRDQDRRRRAMATRE